MNKMVTTIVVLVAIGVVVYLLWAFGTTDVRSPTDAPIGVAAPNPPPTTASTIAGNRVMADAAPLRTDYRLAGAPAASLGLIV